MVCPIKVTYRRFYVPCRQFKNLPDPRRWLTENGQIPEDYLLRMAKSRKMSHRDWPNFGLRQAGISKEDLMK
jgi:hypothetical protein